MFGMFGINYNSNTECGNTECSNTECGFYTGRVKIERLVELYCVAKHSSHVCHTGRTKVERLVEFNRVRKHIAHDGLEPSSAGTETAVE